MHYLKHELIQRGEIVRLLIHQTLQLPVPFKSLEYLAKSNQKEVRVTARYLIATMAEQLTPHLDEVLFQNLIHVLVHFPSYSANLANKQRSQTQIAFDPHPHLIARTLLLSILLVSSLAEISPTVLQYKKQEDLLRLKSPQSKALP